MSRRRGPSRLPDGLRCLCRRLRLSEQLVASVFATPEDWRVACGYASGFSLCLVALVTDRNTSTIQRRLARIRRRITAAGYHMLPLEPFTPVVIHFTDLGEVEPILGPKLLRRLGVDRWPDVGAGIFTTRRDRRREGRRLGRLALALATMPDEAGAGAAEEAE